MGGGRKRRRSLRHLVNNCDGREQNFVENGKSRNVHKRLKMVEKRRTRIMNKRACSQQAAVSLLSNYPIQ